MLCFTGRCDSTAIASIVGSIAMMESFASAYRSEELADADLVLLCSATADSDSRSPSATQQDACDIAATTAENAEPSSSPSEAPTPRVLAKFPAHRLLLCKCEYFKAQVSRQQPLQVNNVLYFCSVANIPVAFLSNCQLVTEASCVLPGRAIAVCCMLCMDVPS